MIEQSGEQSRPEREIRRVNEAAFNFLQCLVSARHRLDVPPS